MIKSSNVLTELTIIPERPIPTMKADVSKGLGPATPYSVTYKKATEKPYKPPSVRTRAYDIAVVWAS